MIRDTSHCFEIKSLLFQKTWTWQVPGAMLASVSRGTASLLLSWRMLLSHYCDLTDTASTVNLNRLSASWRWSVAVSVFSGSSSNPLDMLNIALCSWNWYFHIFSVITMWEESEWCHVCRHMAIALQQEREENQFSSQPWLPRGGQI